MGETGTSQESGGGGEWQVGLKVSNVAEESEIMSVERERERERGRWDYPAKGGQEARGGEKGNQPRGLMFNPRKEKSENFPLSSPEIASPDTSSPLRRYILFHLLFSSSVNSQNYRGLA